MSARRTMKEAFRIGSEIARQVWSNHCSRRWFSCVTSVQTNTCVSDRSPLRPITQNLSIFSHRLHRIRTWQVTAANPAPVTLRLEKIYEPCMLVTKKRYVGFMHESPTQTVPSWDAKVSLP